MINSLGIDVVFFYRANPYDSLEDARQKMQEDLVELDTMDITNYVRIKRIQLDELTGTTVVFPAELTENDIQDGEQYMLYVIYTNESFICRSLNDIKIIITRAKEAYKRHFGYNEIYEHHNRTPVGVHTIDGEFIEDELAKQDVASLVTNDATVSDEDLIAAIDQVLATDGSTPA